MLGDPGALQQWRLFNSKANYRCKGVIIPFISLFIPTPTAKHDWGWRLWGSRGWRSLQGMQEQSWG